MKKLSTLSIFILSFLFSYSQLPPQGVCPQVINSEGNGSAGGCATTTLTGKTGSWTFRYNNSGGTITQAPTITKVFVTTGGVTTEKTDILFGPPAVTLSPPNFDVKYCYYKNGCTSCPLTTVSGNIISFVFSIPNTGAYYTVCSFDAATNAAASTPGAISGILPSSSFVSLKAKEGKLGIDLSWSIDKESDVRGYTIQRSVDGKAFSIASFVGATSIAGNTTVRRNYSFTDKTVTSASSVLYYRIVQEGVSGAAVYSKVTSVNISRLAYGFTVISNPGKIILRKKAGVPPGNYAVSLIGADGTRSATRNFNNADAVTFDNLSKGLFYLQLVSDKGEVRTFAVKAQ
jgi:hypothetical protein